MARVILVTGVGEGGRLPRSAEDILQSAEQTARAQNIAKRSAFPLAVREAIQTAGYEVSDTDLDAAMPAFDAIRRGENRDVAVRVSPGISGSVRGRGDAKIVAKTASDTVGHRFFEVELTYPDPRARARFDRLVGLDDQKARLLLELELLLYPERMEEWSRKHHGGVLAFCEAYRDRPPLVLLEGDVGCGKTVLAESVGSQLAEHLNAPVHLLKVNTQVRGTGLVGEMTDLIVQAFTLCEARAVALNGSPVLLLIDEADALASSRDQHHMHHEDKAGLNTLLQRIDGLRRNRRRVAVLFITNRPDALDPAVRRRAALHLVFGRPDDEARRELFKRLLPELELTNHQLSDLVKATGPHRKAAAGCTPSDITDRIIPAALREAYAQRRPLTAKDVVEQARATDPSPALMDASEDG